MTSFGYRLNPRYTIKECSSCGALYTRDCCCSKGNVKDKILVPKPPKNCARYAWCGHPVDGSYCQGCALLRKKLEEDLVTHFQDFQNTFESSDDSTNVVNAPREPFVVKQDHGSFVDKINCDLNKAPGSPHLHTFSPNQFHCFHCKDVLGYGEAYQRCTCTRVFKIKDAFGNEQSKPEDIQELFCKLLNDLQNIHEELAEYINSPGWNRPAFYNNDDDDDMDYTIVITPILSTKEPENPLTFSFYDDHIEEISSGSTTIHSDISLYEYDLFIFDLSNDQFPPTDRSNFTHEEFADELAHIISPPEYDCF
nr:hypothetical protein [Tanacetum cinerariifolium]